VNPDIAALQEVGDHRGRTGHDQHPELLAEELGMHMAYGPNIVKDGWRYGNAILSRLPILRSRNYDLSVRRRERRGALRCDLDLGDGRVLHVFCLHMGLRARERRAQEALLLSADIVRDAVRSDPLVVCGDFNYWGNGTVPSLMRKALHDAAHVLHAHRLRTYHSKFPFIRLDRVMVDAQVRALSLSTHRTPLARQASDHLPLVFKLLAPVPGAAALRGPVELYG
jgi:endonuclease/exonuclease/phosphatase family metal-dependent hydrolase